MRDAIAIDGKSLRGSGHGARSRAVHLLLGLVHRSGSVIGPVDVESKTNEIPKIRDLLDPLEIAGQIVTVDARNVSSASFAKTRQAGVHGTRFILLYQQDHVDGVTG